MSDTRLGLIVLVLTGQLLAEVNITYDKEWLQSISDTMSMVCPLDNVCHTLTKEELDMNYNIYTSKDNSPCCTGCSCADNCGEWDNCCFPSHTKTDIYDRSNEECIHTEVFTSAMFPLTSYYFYIVVSCDPNINISAKNVKAEYFWGDFYPVFSKKTHKIYKNEYIALCNGIKDGIHWDVALVCKYDASTKLTITDFRQILSGKSYCSLYFAYTQGSPADIRREKCFPVLHDHCHDDFPAPAGLNMSKNEIVSACESDFVSPYMRNAHMTYFPKNIFCAICLRRFSFFSASECSTGYLLNVTENGGRFSSTNFALLLSHNFLVSTTKKRVLPPRMACRPSYNETSNSPDCREVLCPTGQFEQADGKCAFVSNDILLKSASILIRLTPIDRAHIIVLKQTPLAFTNISVVDEPWTQIGWTLSLIYCKHAANYSNTCFLDGFLVDVTRQHIAMNSEKYYLQIKAALTKPMTWQVGTVNMTFHQDIHRHADISRENDNSLLFRLTNENVLLEDHWTHNETLGLLEKILLTAERNAPVIEQITKLHFCSRITLFAEDFHYLGGRYINVMLYKHTHRLLYDSEMIKNPLNDTHPKVCLSDTDFIEVTSSTIAFHFVQRTAIVYMCLYICVLHLI